MKSLFFACFFLFALSVQLVAQPQKDSGKTNMPAVDTVIERPASGNIYKRVLDSNALINASGLPESLPPAVKKHYQPVFFYIIIAVLLFFGILKTGYSRYFNTLFRVFFNTSLRQNQLTDQLEQAVVPSFLYNLFFTFTGGLYAYLLLRYFSLPSATEDWPVLFYCIAAVAGCYMVKYLTLRITGWLTHYRSEAGTYIFIIFLLNKVAGILLLPFIIVILFSSRILVSYSVFISLLMLAFFLLLRFLRSYALLQHRLKLTRFHLFLYVIALEILPIALIYRGVVLFFAKNP